MAENIETNADNTATEKNADLEAIKAEIAKLKDENEKLRKANTNASADASKWKKELQSKMSEDEKAEATRKEEREAILAELNALKRDKAVSEHTANFLSLGFEDSLARASAEAMNDGDTTKLFANLKAFIENHDKTINAEAIRNIAKPKSGNSGATITAEQFAKMGLSERTKLFNENPTLYNELNGK